MRLRTVYYEQIKFLDQYHNAEVQSTRFDAIGRIPWVIASTPR